MEKLNHSPKRIIAAVTNDLHQDQRMQRICSSLQAAGYEMELVGKQSKGKQPLLRPSRIKGQTAVNKAIENQELRSKFLPERSYRQTRLHCIFSKGKLFYLEYNLRLCWFLLFRQFDTVCAVDTDTLTACFFAAKLKGKPCVLDAHEYFSEVPEVQGRPFVKAIWEAIAFLLIPRLRYCYTVGETLAEALSQRYGVSFEVIRNLPLRRTDTESRLHPGIPYIILYQGMLNAGRGLEEMIRAMATLENVQLWIAGKGDLELSLRQLAQPLIDQGKVVFLGFVAPEHLPELTSKADIGINLLEDKSLSYRFSLANKALDYIQAGIPSIQMDFPEYQRLHAQFGVFVCIKQLDAENIIKAVQQLQHDRGLYDTLKQNCLQAANVLHWGAEEPKLLALYERVFESMR